MNTSSHLKIGPAEAISTVSFPPELLAHTGFSPGDWVEVVEVRDGIKLVRADREFVEQMAVAELVMDENRDLLKRLADS